MAACKQYVAGLELLGKTKAEASRGRVSGVTGEGAPMLGGCHLKRSEGLGLAPDGIPIRKGMNCHAESGRPSESEEPVAIKKCSNNRRWTLW